MRRAHKHDTIRPVFRLLVGCLIALSLGIVLPTHKTHNFDTSYKPAQTRQATSRRTVLDLTEAKLEKNIDRISHEPNLQGSLARLIGPPVASLTALTPVSARPLLPFVMRRKLASRRANNPDPLV
jgi:hypothetical protein